MKKLYLITDGFPYGRGEKPFISPELPFLLLEYDVTIIACADETAYQDREHETRLDESIRVIRYPAGKLSFIDKLWGIVVSLGEKEVWRETGDIIKSGNFILPRLFRTFGFYTSAKKFQKWLVRTHVFCPDEAAVYYTYWNSVHTFGLTMMKNHYPWLKIITRLHGYDLYNERAVGGRQPFKKQMDEKLDRVILASEYGYEYYRKYFADPDTPQKYHLCKLGIKGEGSMGPFEHTGVFRIVSCSNVVPLKRIEKIIDGLSALSDSEIEWLHFGDGENMESVKRYAREKLGHMSNISFRFMGHVQKGVLIQYYQENPVDCFITTTSTEGGCPVSIQEALSFGIPIIGTDVGGVTAMIDGNGVLLSSIPEKEEVAQAIYQALHWTEEERQRCRKRSLELWDRDYNIDKNGPKLLKIIREIDNQEEES